MISLTSVGKTSVKRLDHELTNPSRSATKLDRMRKLLSRQQLLHEWLHARRFSQDAVIVGMNAIGLKFGLYRPDCTVRSPGDGTRLSAPMLMVDKLDVATQHGSVSGPVRTAHDSAHS